MQRIKFALLAFLIAFFAIQFLQPARNKSGQTTETDIAKVYTMPADVKAIFVKSCYDCHSNNTRYPWYSFIQPAAWWMDQHVREGKEELNFNQFGEYTKRRRLSKLKSIVSSVKDESMPLPSYLILHPNARLTEQEKILVINWIEGIRERERTDIVP